MPAQPVPPTPTLQPADDALQSAIDTAVAAAIAQDPTLSADYTLRDQLTATLETTRTQLAACLQRIAQKEGADIATARAKQKIMAMTTQDFQSVGQRLGLLPAPPPPTPLPPTR